MADPAKARPSSVRDDAELDSPAEKRQRLDTGEVSHLGDPHPLSDHPIKPAQKKDSAKQKRKDNVEKQRSDSKGEVAYLMADIAGVGEGEVEGVWNELEALGSRIRTRVLY